MQIATGLAEAYKVAYGNCGMPVGAIVYDDGGHMCDPAGYLCDGVGQTSPCPPHPDATC